MIETRPSNSYRWVPCSAAPLHASTAEPQPESDPAREGTCAAWCAEHVMTGCAPDAYSMIGICHTNGWEIDDEMAGHVQDYVDICLATPGQHFTEQHVRLSDRIAGTLDSATLTDDGVLIVRDLKYGRRLVECDTPQLIIYAGAMLSIVGQVHEVWTEIYQPRGYHHDGIHRRKKWTAREIWEACQHIDGRAQLCYLPRPTATPGTHCLDCEGADGCAALQATAANIVAMVERPDHRQKTPQEMAEGLSFMRWAEKLVKAAAQAAETEALARHMRGDRLPGWGVTEKLGNRQVTANADTVRAMTGKDPMAGKNVKLTIADLKRAKLTDAQIELFTDRSTTGHKLEPLNTDALARRFNKPEETT